ncbi:MAG: protein translocase subunit SecF [Bryobacteraceae bacterium]
MDILKNTNFDFLGRKWPFIIASLALIGAGVVSIALKGGIQYGIDFTGGSLMYVKFSSQPPVDKIRSALSARGLSDVQVQNLADAENEVIITTELKDERELDKSRSTMIDTLTATFGEPQSGKLDFNNASQEALVSRLRDPLQRAGVQLAEPQLVQLVKDILAFRNTPPRSGLLSSFDQLSGVSGVNAAVINTLKQECYLAPFTVRQVEIVGPKVAKDLQRQAVLATLYALGGMLVYIGFRFEWIYGFAAVTAVFHDTLITIGFFSLFDKRIDLTVVAALLTLVGYSMNDTIVIFDRVRENLKILRREPLESLMNRSVNQTLGRTILTSGLTFLSVMALFLFGGPVLHPFSFALVVGIIVGTYSTVFIASPIVLFWQDWVEGRKRATAPVVAPAARPVANAEPKQVAKPAQKPVARKAK